MYKVIIAFLLLVGFFIPSLAFSKIDIKWKDIGKRTGFDTVPGYNNPFSLASTIVNTVLSLLTIIFLAAMLYGGLRWMTAQGENDKIEKAQVAIKAGVIGLVIALSSYAISYFVFSKLLSSQATTNCAKLGGQCRNSLVGPSAVCNYGIISGAICPTVSKSGQTILGYCCALEVPQVSDGENPE